MRVLVPADAAALYPLISQVQTLHAVAMPQRFHANLDRREMADHFAAWLGQADVFALGAERHGALVGYAVFEVIQTQDKTFTKGERFGFLHHIVVDRDFRRAGIGSRLIEAGKRELRARDVIRLESSYWGFNDASAALMRRAGLTLSEVFVEGVI
ncbi:MAG: GNAT family N-acetyltransferase [Pseudomonadota bacterium]